MEYWATRLGEKGLAGKTVEQYISHVQTLRVERGWRKIRYSEELHRIVTGIGNGYKVKRPEREHMTWAHIRRMLAHLQWRTNDEHGLMAAAIVVPWATAARPQEVMAKTRARDKRWMLDKHVTWAKEGITLHSPHTKNKKRGITRFISAIATADGEASAYDVVESYMKARKKEDESPFLRHADGNPLLYNNFGKKLKRLVEEAGIEENVTAGSGRPGFVTQARESGVSEEKVRAAGAWASKAFNLYDKSTKTQRDTSKRMQLHAMEIPK
jgi:hypothetical protein